MLLRIVLEKQLSTVAREHLAEAWWMQEQGWNWERQIATPLRS